MYAIWKKIEHWDQIFFTYINCKGSNHFFDMIMPWMREATTWAPLYLFIGVFILYNFRLKALPWIITFIATVSLSDIISSRVVKELIIRVRPCRDPFFSQNIHVLAKYCPMSSSFTSSHASNHFAMAMLIWITGKHIVGKKLRLFFLWATLVCYAQVYVGVHYPLDVIGGALLGMGIGFIAGTAFNKYFKLYFN